MVSECCVPLCKKKGGYSFPFSRPKVLKGWIIAVKRDKWQPTKYSVVCSAHFEDKDFVEKTIYGNYNFYLFYFNMHITLVKVN